MTSGEGYPIINSIGLSRMQLSERTSKRHTQVSRGFFHTLIYTLIYRGLLSTGYIW